MRAAVASALCIALGFGVLEAPAHAGPAERAEQLFKKGKKLLAEKRFAEACTAFEDSDRLDPGIGAKLNVAKCYQEWGRLATAWRWFSDAERLAETAKDDRAEKIRALKDELDASVPRLTLKVPAGADASALAVQLDSAPLTAAELGVERRVDPGPHQIDYMIDGVKRTKTVPVERGGSSEVTLEAPARGTAAPAPRPMDAPASVADPDVGKTRRIVGLGLSAAGVVAVGIAGFVTLGARGDYNDALDDHCRGARDMCDAEGLTLTADARSTANTATVVTIAGGVAVVGGLALYFLAPRAKRDEHALYIAPSIGRSGGTVVVGGAF